MRRIEFWLFSCAMVWCFSGCDSSSGNDRCVPATCAAAGVNCGTISDGCGGRLSCGACAAPEICGGGGANVCGTGVCAPKTCVDLTANCGEVSDGCSELINCGACSGSETCGGGGTANQCGCIPVTCAEAGKNCGLFNDGCGRLLQCGTCDESSLCGGSGVANVCGVPPRIDPADVAPPIDPTVTTTVAEATEFLYTGSSPIQMGVIPGTIEPQRASVLRGVVRDREGAPLVDVRVSIRERPELGWTFSREDGAFDLAVNGGDRLTVGYDKDGFLPAERTLSPTWQAYDHPVDVALVPLDPQVTEVDFSLPLQVAQGSPVTDADGTRRTIVVFEEGTQATMVLPDGTIEPLPSIHVRATEYTVGQGGPSAMPAELPSTSAYTWAVELSVDEALAAGATEVRFDRPVSVYQSNFLGFPTGTVVPMGYYDRTRAAWVPEDNGLVIAIVAVSNGLAELDVDGSGTAATAQELEALGITAAERAEIAGIYGVGEQFWRMRLRHFSPLDGNWPCRPNLDPDDPSPEKEEPNDNPCEQSGSIIACQNQSLGEMFHIAGTPFGLRYQSDRQLGYRAASTVGVTLSRSTINGDIKRFELNVEVAGQKIARAFVPATGVRDRFMWDGRDAYGRLLQGRQTAKISVGWVYDLAYTEPAPGTRAFGLYSSNPDVTLAAGSGRLREMTLWKRAEIKLGVWDARGHGALGGWSLSAHHVYDPSDRVLYRGDGRRRSARNINRTITTSAGTGNATYGGDGGAATLASLNQPSGLAFDGTGSLFVADRENHRVRRIDPNGTITTVVGNGTPGFSGDGGLATSAELYWPEDVAVDGRGNLYVADAGNHRVRRVTPNGRIQTVVGTSSPGYSGDGGPAVGAKLSSPKGIALDPEANLYIADTYNHVVRRVSRDGIITTVAGTGAGGFHGDGGLATAARLFGPADVALDPEGNLYVADAANNRVRRINPSGIITTVAGDGRQEYDGDGGPASSAALNMPVAIAVDAARNLYIVDQGNQRVRFVQGDGIIVTAAGDGVSGFAGDGDAARAARLNTPTGMALHPLGAIAVADGGNHRLRRVELPLPSFSEGDIVVADAEDDDLFIFDANGRHQYTVDGLTGARRYAFAYDQNGRLSSVTDGRGRSTLIERDAAGNPRAIVAPSLQRTELAVDERGYLARIADPAGRETLLTHDEAGLLRGLRDAAGEHTFAYDDAGRLTRDTHPVAGETSLARTSIAGGHEVTLTAELGLTKKYETVTLPSGALQDTITHPSGLVTHRLTYADGSEVIERPDGSVTTVRYGPDPRFGMARPRIAFTSKSTASGLTSTTSFTRSAELVDPSDPFSVATSTVVATDNGASTTSVYDAATRTLTGTTAAGRQQVTTYDAQNRPVLVTYPGTSLASLAVTYDDSASALVQMRQGTRTLTTTYDAQGNLAGITDPDNRVYSVDHDALGRVVAVTLPDLRQIHAEYDTAGHLMSFTPPGKSAHLFTYDPRGVWTVYDPPETGEGPMAISRVFDAEGRLTETRQPDGTSIFYDYDAAGRITAVVDPMVARTYTYDSATSAMIGADSSYGVTMALGWDSDLQTSVAWSGAITGSVENTYNNDRTLHSESVNGAQPLEFAYDLDGLVTRVGALELSYKPGTPLVSTLTMQGGVRVTETLTHNEIGEVIGKNVAVEPSGGGAATTVYSVTYARDMLGRISHKDETAAGVHSVLDYAYDMAGRLNEVRQGGVVQAAIEHDSNDNRTTFTAGSVTTGTYDAQDRIITDGGRTYGFTKNGTLETVTEGSATTTYTYDSHGDLIAVELPSGDTISYVIDGFSHRVQRRENGVVTQAFLYEPGVFRPAAQLDASSNVVSRFVYARRSMAPEYMIRQDVTYRIITDHLGSPLLVIDLRDGSIAQQMQYDAFGNVIVDTNPGFQPFGFAGGLYDAATGLVRFGARDYDAHTGRWTARDRILFGGGSTNLFNYGGGDPINIRDPRGEIGCLGLIVVAVVVVAVVVWLWGDDIRDWFDKETKDPGNDDEKPRDEYEDPPPVPPDAAEIQRRQQHWTDEYQKCTLNTIMCQQITLCMVSPHLPECAIPEDECAQ